jgi:hypothetical protein
MKNIINKIGILVVAMMLIGVSSCDDKLTDLNKNPNAINAEDGNVNLLMPTVLGPFASNYLNLGTDAMSGGMQHTQKSGWAGGHNYYGWGGDWSGYFDILRTNDLLINNASEKGFPFHEGVGLTMRAFIFGHLADMYGDVPYSAALKGNEGGIENQYPSFDSQEAVYTGVLADLEAAAALFASGDDTFVDGSADLYFGGDMEAWERFANSLRIRYLVRISPKNTSVQSTVESIVSGGKFISSSDQDATLDYTGGANDQWPIQYDDETTSTRYQAAKTLIDQMNSTNDPRIRVWFDPVRVRWVADNALAVPFEDQMRVDGVLTDIYPDWIDYRGTTNDYTRHFNPNDTTFDDSEFVGVAPGIFQSDVHIYNGNPVGGQGRHNIHVSMLTETFMDGQASQGDLLQARLVSAAEMHFTLAEMSINGWSVGDAEEHYEAGIKASLETWGVDDQYDAFISEVPFDGTVEQVITQKWVASFTSATEAWNDYKRTGFPVLSVGEGAAAPVPAIRFSYGGDELNNNTDNVNSAIDRLETTEYSGAQAKNSPICKDLVVTRNR